MELIVITTGQESACFLDDLEAPALSIVMSGVHLDHIFAINVDCADSAVVMPDQNLSIHEINRRCME